MKPIPTRWMVLAGLVAGFAATAGALPQLLFLWHAFHHGGL